ncbi:HAD-like domain-containing protein [Protomyces lactucae-debilis]|uniref:HAD-like domain-containing protein n=1 Tax=Protomyces lactucae-debilis TaxID=2754530 RepID=A0A1Y2EZB5_PROLT|nr:HAD-like domain-containing protein [Protomyces lactucae-debilis]ORY76604.1 HAD-like domain-containing protein [Protomyces lactucae-debilis]
MLLPRLQTRITSCSCRLLTTRFKSTSSKKPFAFAFDIDGVLLKSSQPIPGAIEALALLKKHAIPFILLTNGGGSTEAERVARLSEYLKTEIHPSNFVQSHTPFQLHAAQRRFKNVLVCGGKGDVCRQVALGYDFPHVTIPFDILAQDESVWPYHQLSQDDRSITRPLSDAPIDAIYVYHDPRDWGLDSQIVLDLLLSKGGRIGTRADHPTPEKPNESFEQAVPLFYSNPDLVWSNLNPHPRFGQGAFQILIQGLYKAITGTTLHSTTIGKPSKLMYDYAAQVLAKHQKRLNPHLAADQTRVYMVGDNKLSDIAGANAYQWTSILVQSGVFRGTIEEGKSGSIPADHVVKDVGEAVKLVLAEEGIL